MVLATCVQVAHWGIVAASVSAPFCGDRYIALADAVWLAGVMIHWLCTDNTCALSVLEKALRGVDDQQSFFYNLMSTIFTPDFANATTAKLVWGLTMCLCLFCVYQA